MAQQTLIKQYGCFNLVHFSEKSCPLSTANPKILAFVTYCSANFQQISDFFMPNFKLMYEDSENIKADQVNTVVFNLHQSNQTSSVYFGTPGRFDINIAFKLSG